MSYSVIALIMGVIMIYTLVLFSRTKRMGENNLFQNFLLAVAVITATVYTSLHPSWWTLAILAAFMAILWGFFIYNQPSMARDKPVLTHTGAVAIALTLVVTTILILTKQWAWYSALVWIPGGLYGLIILLLWTERQLKKI